MIKEPSKGPFEPKINEIIVDTWTKGIKIHFQNEEDRKQLLNYINNLKVPTEIIQKIMSISIELTRKIKTQTDFNPLDEKNAEKIDEYVKNFLEDLLKKIPTQKNQSVRTDSASEPKLSQEAPVNKREESADKGKISPNQEEKKRSEEEAARIARENAARNEAQTLKPQNLNRIQKFSENQRLHVQELMRKLKAEQQPVAAPSNPNPSTQVLTDGEQKTLKEILNSGMTPQQFIGLKDNQTLEQWKGEFDKRDKRIPTIKAIAKAQEPIYLLLKDKKDAVEQFIKDNKHKTRP